LGGPAAHRAFNIATLGHRQPGSAFKPFTLAAALEHGYSAASVVTSAPYHQTTNGEVWNVRNAEASYVGKERLDRATWHSRQHGIRARCLGGWH